jgi:hypothetical protein
LLGARPQVYFCFREAKGKNTEAGSRKFPSGNYL